MANWYDFGTATVAAGGTTVTLSAGALALQNIRVGDGFVVKGASFPPVEILTVPTNLTFTIDAWPYAAQTGVAYTIQPGPAWSSIAAVAQDVSEYLAAISGVQNSDTTNTVGTGSKVWYVQPNLRLSVGARVRFADIGAPTTRYMDGIVTSYAGRALTVEVDRAIGSGSSSLWNINFAGELGTPGTPGTDGSPGTDGDDGWSPVLAVVTDSARRVHQVIDWTGGTGTKPTTGQYVGASGLVATAALAVDIRGAAGADGSGLTDGDKGDVIVSAGGTAFTLDVTGVVAGDYTNVNLTVDAKGRVTDIENGVAASVADAIAYHGLQVNGFQQISQENGDTAVGNGAYPVDQEAIAFSGPTCTAQRVATPFTSRLDIPRGIKIEATTGASIGSGDVVVAFSKIEGERLRGRLNWGSSIAAPLKIGRVIRSNVSGRGYCSARNGAANRSYVVPFDLVANTDTWVEVTIPGDTSGTWTVDNTAGLIVAWTFGVGSTFQTTANAWRVGNYTGASDCTNFFSTTGNKVWLGPMVVLTGLELPTFAEIMRCQRHQSDELNGCRRYWESSYSIGVVPGTVTLVGATYMVTQATLSYHSLPAFVWTEKRTTPTATVYSPNTGATSKMWKQGVGDINSAITGVGTRGGTPFVNGVSVAASEGLYEHYKADARM